MKIVHVSIYPPKGEKHSSAGGVASYSKNLVTNIPYNKNDNIFVLCNIINNVETYTEEGITVKRCFKKNIFTFLKIYKNIKEINPDIVHIQQELNLYGGFVNAYLFQWMVFLLRRYKIIVTLHGVVSLKLVNKNFVKENNSKLPVSLVKKALRIIYKPICFFSKKIIVHDDYFKEILIDEYEVNADKIKVIPHGVEELKRIPKEEARRILGFDLKKNIVLFMGYATGYKGMDLLIEGFGQYAKLNSNSFLIIAAGKHPKLLHSKEYLVEYERLMKKAADMIPSNQYTWRGFIEEKKVGVYYSAADISVYPYTIQMSSSGPMAISIGYNVPFLCSDAFQSHFIKDIFSFKRSSNSLSEKIGQYFGNEEMYNQMLSEIRIDLLWSVLGKKYAEIYSSFLQN